MSHMTLDEISAQLRYCEIMFRSGVFSGISSAEEMFAIVEGGKAHGKSAFESLATLRFQDGLIVLIADDADPVSSPCPTSTPISPADTMSVAVPQPVTELKVTVANPEAVSSVSSSDQEAIDMYVDWLSQIKDMKSLDRLLYRLKFEEDREPVKAAVRPVFRDVMKKIEAQEALERRAANNNAATFRVESNSKAYDYKDLEGVSGRTEVHQSANKEDARKPDDLRHGDEGTRISPLRQAVDNSSEHSSVDLVEVLSDIITRDIETDGYAISAFEKKHMIAKIVGCASADELYVAAESINKYYLKNTNTSVIPLLDKLCAERLKSLIAVYK